MSDDQNKPSADEDVTPKTPTNEAPVAEHDGEEKSEKTENEEAPKMTWES